MEKLIRVTSNNQVAIPAAICYNYFQRRIQSPLANTEALTNVLLAHLNAEEPPAPVPVTQFPAPAAVPSSPGDS